MMASKSMTTCPTINGMLCSQKLRYVIQKLIFKN